MLIYWLVTPSYLISFLFYLYLLKQGLFGTFDFTPFFDSYGWLALATILFISIKVPRYWLVTPSYWISTRIKFQKLFSRILKLNFGLHGKPITIRFIFNIFCFILLANYLGIFWSGFSIFGHLLIPSLILVCLPLFLRVFNPRRFRSFICPKGSPWWLNLFICVVEFLSIIIRPLTLSLRIACNITVGHILMGLAFSYSSSLYISLILCFGLVLVIFEIFVCLIQAYVFSNLVSLFCSPTSSREKDRYH